LDTKQQSKAEGREEVIYVTLEDLSRQRFQQWKEVPHYSKEI